MIKRIINKVLRRHKPTAADLWDRVIPEDLPTPSDGFVSIARDPSGQWYSKTHESVVTWLDIDPISAALREEEAS